MLAHPTLKLAAFAAVSAMSLGACSTSSSTPTGTTEAASTTITLADAYGLGGYNPVAGYADLGVSLIYDGLMGLDSPDGHAMPTIIPKLAAEEPQHNDDFTQWDVVLRDGVTFHDGSTFDAADVVATYEAILDPASASEIASSVEMVDKVSATRDGDKEGVTFTLKYPYRDFASRLLLAIAPSERLTGGPASESSLNREPVGTGPYRLEELTADRAIFVANESYWGGVPQVTKVIKQVLPDDNARVMRIKAGEFDGTTIPPALAKAFDYTPGLSVVTAQSADWRGISLPPEHPFAQNPQVRFALNLAVDREAMIATVLGGYGELAHTPVSHVYGDSFDAKAVFPHDPDRAQQILADEGWVLGSDGVLAKGAHRAEFTLAYNPTDTVRRDLATAFAADMIKIGVKVSLEGIGWDKLASRADEVGILLGGGDKPYSLDTQVFAALHTPVPGSSQWDNPGKYGSVAMDTLLDEARATADEAERARLYREVQAQYMAEPSYVMLVFLEHTYVMRDNEWKRGTTVVEPHAHGIDWGPWWDLAAWKR